MYPVGGENALKMSSLLKIKAPKGVLGGVSGALDLTHPLPLPPATIRPIWCFSWVGLTDGHYRFWDHVVHFQGRRSKNYYTSFDNNIGLDVKIAVAQKDKGNRGLSTQCMVRVI